MPAYMRTRLDGSGALLTFFPNLSDIRTAPLGLASEWRTPLAAATFSERLYVLDPGSGEIWKYFPDGEGFRVDEAERAIEFSQDPFPLMEDKDTTEFTSTSTDAWEFDAVT